MGLDMYLEKRTKQETKEEVMYWRKAYAIHAWFTRLNMGLENCEDLIITRNHMQALVDTITKIQEDQDLAPILLPTASGFFYGSTEYNEYYFDELNRTKKALVKILAEPDDNQVEYVYHAWW